MRPREGGGYTVEAQTRRSARRDAAAFTADSVVFAGGVMGTVPLLLAMQRRPRRPAQALAATRASSCAPTARRSSASSRRRRRRLLEGRRHHVDPAHRRALPHRARSLRRRAPASSARSCSARAGPTTLAQRLRSRGRRLLQRAVRSGCARLARARLRASTQQILLYMRTLEGTLSLRLGVAARGPGSGSGLVTKLDDPERAPARVHARRRPTSPSASPRRSKGVTMTLLTETLLGVPSTAHILGGACIGGDAERRRDRRSSPGLRLSRPLRGRRLGGLGEPGREPVADDHRDGGARDVVHSCLRPLSRSHRSMDLLRCLRVAFLA